MKKSRIGALGFSGLLVLALCAGGCGLSSKSNAVPLPERDRLRNVANLVNEYQSTTKKRATKIDEVRDWAVKEGKASQEDFVSTRDNQPYVIAFTAMGLVVYEQTGKNGKCYMMARGGVTEMSADQVRQLLKQGELGPGGKPKPKKLEKG